MLLNQSSLTAFPVNLGTEYPFQTDCFHVVTGIQLIGGYLYHIFIFIFFIFRKRFIVSGGGEITFALQSV
ncbi:hypothetical protein BDV28DRAFT_135881 [Aspergillus coremiiformis]|uniref:Uncharacterized protein n=1 Tax=Aspergillus coremiiformis TaxID=138285 RepID=A0A5N6Z2Y6_9EURO|nr:hypothetical protein BDV28DRAFT_135881 [Aspergillus coremiiformis]